ncbi:hypothetical protein JSE7799_01876 [Jannaschia seosinensis]|uniref:Rhamnosyl transferase n=1 Tax=Jannaschia seosinensis TaxID=313367 RepID=A0A0M7BCU3_9RHOB|nr:glycosyltransferase [Jannaschia seosinensis]CUH39155.1 hypothetical protein JSE7799_01876 [Jannaschia seosinensis]
MSEPVVGLCRFSFAGRGDWVAWRDLDEAQATEKRLELAETLYAPARMALRFRTLETLLLPSLAAQTDPNWHLVLLTSDLMPAACRERLESHASDRVHVVVSDAPRVDLALLPALERLGFGAVPQFRIDDDDALATSYVERLRRMAAGMAGAGVPAWSFSVAHSLVVALYAGQSPRAYRSRRPFMGAGAAARLPERARAHKTVYGFGHFALSQRWTSVTDNGAPGQLITRFDGHDSLRLEEGSRPMAWHEPMEWSEFKGALGRHFGFADPVRLRDLAAA